jgi:hypothetical protein
VQPVAEAVEARGRVEEAAKAAARSMLFRRRFVLSIGRSGHHRRIEGIVSDPGGRSKPIDRAGSFRTIS